MIPCQREFFNIPEEIAYLNCAYLSPVMRTVREAGIYGIDRKSQPWKIKPVHFFDKAEEARSLFAQLISANSDDIALIPACSYGLATAAANIDLQAGDEIVILHEQFPSNVYVWLEAAKQHNASVKTVSRGEEETWTEAVLRLLGEKTRVVSIPNVHWTDGALIDVQRVAEECRNIGADLILDVTQSLGAYPFSIAGIRPSFVVCSAYKWLFGPYSMAFMYVSPDYQNGKPIENNWLNRKDSEDFAGLVNYKDDFQPGARRFDVGERSNFTLLPMVIAALRQILEWTVPEINKTLSAMNEYLADEVMALGLEVGQKDSRAGHMLGVRFPDGLPAGLLDALAENQVFVSVRGNAVRVAPHVYNDPRDLEKAASTIKKVTMR